MDISYVRDQFPITNVILPKTENAESRPLIFLDHGASTHAPRPVIETYLDVLENHYANVHRGEHTLSRISTEMYEHASDKVAKLVGIKNLQGSGMEVFMTTNTTSSLDLASHIFANVEGDYVSTALEHHSNDLPHRNRGKTHHVTVDERGILDLDHLQSILDNNKVKLVAVSAGSNVSGYVPHIYKIARMAHDSGAKILVDGAQRMAHMSIDMKPLDHPEHIDFLAGGGHKMYAPMGSSFLIGNTSDGDAAPPYIPGGGTVKFVTENEAIYLNGPERHCFGTPNIAGAIALGRAAEFLMDVGMDQVRSHELELLEHTMKRMPEIEGVRILGDIPLDRKIGVISFTVDGIHHSRVSSELDRIGGVATRNGCFCAHPYLLHLLKVNPKEIEEIRGEILSGNLKPETKFGAVRATIGIYNTLEEMDTFVDTLERIVKSG